VSQQAAPVEVLALEDTRAQGPAEPVTDQHHEIVLRVFSPRHPDPKVFAFQLDLTVGEAATKANAAFGVHEGTPTFKRLNGDVLDRNLTLRASGLHQREEVEIVDAGGGV
jgi:hypothetical protein